MHPSFRENPAVSALLSALGIVDGLQQYVAAVEGTPGQLLLLGRDATLHPPPEVGPARPNPSAAAENGPRFCTLLVQLGQALHQLVEATHPSAFGVGGATSTYKSTPAAASSMVEPGDSMAEEGPLWKLVEEYGGEITRLFVFLSVLAALPTDAADTAADAEEAARQSPTICLGGPVDDTVLQSVLLCSCGVAANLSAAMAGIPLLTISCPNAWWRCTILVLQRYHHHRGILHFLLSVLANIASCAALCPSPDDCITLYGLVLPDHCRTPLIVDAWMAVFCNLTATHATAVVPALLQHGVVAEVQKLTLTMQTATSPAVAPNAAGGRLTANALQLLSNIALHVLGKSCVIERANGEEETDGC